MHKAPKRRPLSTAAEGSKRGRQLSREPKRCESNCKRERARVCVCVWVSVCVRFVKQSHQINHSMHLHKFSVGHFGQRQQIRRAGERESKSERELSIGNYSCRQAGRREGRQASRREGSRKEGSGFVVKSIGLGRIGRAYLSSTAHSLVAAKGNYTT